MLNSDIYKINNIKVISAQASIFGGAIYLSYSEIKII